MAALKRARRRLWVDNGLSLIMRMIVSSQGIAVKVWRNSAVSCGAMRVFPSDTILAALGDVSSNPSFFLNVPHLSARARHGDLAVQRTVI